MHISGRKRLSCACVSVCGRNVFPAASLHLPCKVWLTLASDRASRLDSLSATGTLYFVSVKVHIPQQALPSAIYSHVYKSVVPRRFAAFLFSCIRKGFLMGPAHRLALGYILPTRPSFLSPSQPAMGDEMKPLRRETARRVSYNNSACHRLALQRTRRQATVFVRSMAAWGPR